MATKKRRPQKQPTPLALRLAEVRERKGLSRKDLAGLLGWSEMKVYRVETGWTRVLGPYVSEYAEALGVPVSSLYRHPTVSA